MGTSTLSIQGHVALRCEGGVPEAEYALFDEGDVELRSFAPGTAREDAYTTTVERARARLEAAGVSAQLAAGAAAVIPPRIKEAFARGGVVRPIVCFLGPTELFAGCSFDPTARRYRGTWLDLDGLASASGLTVEGASCAFQALHLAALLAECEGGAQVTLTTRDLTRDAPSGARTFRRVAVAHAANVPDALRKLGERVLPPRAAAPGPTRDELLADVQARMALAPDAATQERLLAVERALAARPRPSVGPLADDALWALELQLTVGDAKGVDERCDAIDRSRGRTPATTYLRARAALLTGAEAPAALAERVSALASAMDGFRELTLLAAQAWAAAGDLERAHAYARDLADDPHAHAELRARAADLADDAAAGRQPRISVAPPPIGLGGVPKRRTSLRGFEVDPRSESPSAPVSAPFPSGEADTAVELSLLVLDDATLIDDDLTALFDDSDAPDSPCLEPITIPRDRPGLAVAQASLGPATTLASMTYDPTALHDAAAETAVVPSPGPRRGGSRPPFAIVAPPTRSMIPEQPLAPLPQQGRSEPIERLSLPPGLHGQSPTSELLPRTVLDARVLFTHLARDLARELREKTGVTIRTDAAGIDAIQRDLRARFAPGTGITDGTAFAMRRHGALLSEVLARTLGAYWMDIAPSELGYWTMVMPSPSRTVRILPFGRIYRFVALGPGEKDLVASFRALSALVHGGRG